MAHQWWAQLPPARVEGAAVLTESLAWYSRDRGRGADLRPRAPARLLGIMRQPYLTPRSRADVPLLRAVRLVPRLPQGPVRDVRAERVHRRGAGEPTRCAPARASTPRASLRCRPRSISTAELQAVTPDSLQYLLHDLFEANTFWELETRASHGEQTRRALAGDARRAGAQGGGRHAGVETEVPMDDLVEIGVFAGGKRTAGRRAVPDDAPPALRRAAHHRDRAEQPVARRHRPAAPADRRQGRRRPQRDRLTLEERHALAAAAPQSAVARQAGLRRHTVQPPDVHDRRRAAGLPSPRPPSR